MASAKAEHKDERIAQILCEKKKMLSFMEWDVFEKPSERHFLVERF